MTVRPALRPAAVRLLALLLLAVSGRALAATHPVQVGGNSLVFSPQSLTIRVGDTVTWTNAGGFHNVAADDGSFGNAASTSTWSFSHTFDQPGVVGYHCEVHGLPSGGMFGTITVEAAPSGPGSLQFSGVSFSGGEGGNAGVVVTRTGGTEGEVAASYATSDGSATAGLDYTPVAGTVAFADGEGGTKGFAVPLLADDTAEGSESFGVTLSAPSGGAVLGSPSTATVLILEGTGGGSALTAAEVACDGRRLAGLLARAAAASPRTSKPPGLALSSTATGDFAGIAYTGNGPVTPERHLAFSTNPEETTLLRNPERPQLFSISMTRNELNSDLVPAGSGDELFLTLNPTLEVANPLPANLLRIDDLAGAAGRAADAKPGRGLGSLLDRCHADFAARDVHVFRVLAKLARAKGSAGGAELAIYRGEAPGTYRIDAYPLAPGGAATGRRLAVELAVTFGAAGELSGGTMRVLPRCGGGRTEGCTSVDSLAELVLLRPVAAGRIAPESPYRVSTRGTEGDGQPESPVDWADLLAGTSWRRPL